MSFSPSPTTDSGRADRAVHAKPAHSSGRATNPAHRPLMTIKQARDYVCLGNTKLHELLASGQIHAVKLGRRTMVEVASLDAFIAKLPAAKFKAPK